MKIISLFNHKGGVSKTTTAFNLGWALAERGHKTLIVDADPQCNLTGLVADYSAIEDLEAFYKNHPRCDLYSCVSPVLNGSQEPLAPASPIATGNPHLSLLAGHIALAESETQVSVAVGAGASLPAMRNIPGSFGHLIRMTAETHGFEYVLIDMSPSVGAFNQSLLMGSDYFIVPTFPDFFCEQAVKSLKSVIPRWNEGVRPFRSAHLTYPFPDNPPKFIGIVSQKYRPRSGAPSSSFQKWIDRIKETVESDLIPPLKEEGMAVEESVFHACISADTPYNLANIADFNSLIAQAQKFNVPVFALTDQQIEQTGVILENMKESRDTFRHVLGELADGVICLTNQ